MPRTIALGLLIAAAFALHGCKAASESEENPLSESAATDDAKSLDLNAAFQPTGVVTDAAQIFDGASESALVTKLEGYNRTAKHPIVVATVPTLDGKPTQIFADNLARRWRAGQEDRGVFLLIAPSEGQMWMSVADGSLERLPNQRSQQIVDTLILPAFQQGNFYAGTDGAIDAIISELR